MSPNPAPPQRSPIVMPKSSALRIASHAHCGNSSVSSPWRAIGASSRAATSRASWRSAAWSSVSANGFAPSAWADMPEAYSGFEERLHGELDEVQNGRAPQARFHDRRGPEDALLLGGLAGL